MTQKNLKNIKHIFCPNCRNLISFEDIFSKINRNLEFLFCNLCGIKINLSDYGLECYYNKINTLAKEMDPMMERSSLNNENNNPYEIFSREEENYEKFNKLIENKILMVKKSTLDYQLSNILSEFFVYGENFKLSIFGIYFICKILPEKYGLDKNFFTGNELNNLLQKHNQFFNIVQKKLKQRKFIKYFGNITKESNSNRKMWKISKKCYLIISLPKKKE
jgi:hypothetical protein